MAKKEPNRKVKRSICKLIYVPSLASGHEQRVDNNNETASVCDQNELPPKGGGSRPKVQDEELGHPGGSQSGFAALLYQEEPKKEAQASG